MSGKSKLKKIVTALVVLGLFALAVGYVGAQLIIKGLTFDGQGVAEDYTDAEHIQELIQKGAYISRSADCMACHTAPGGKQFAGGLAMQTPFGAIYTTNVTPDKETGIGRYTYAQFKTAVVHGVRNDGASLYPAMPYPSYSRMTEDEMRALYIYFMRGIEPVYQVNAKPTLPKLFQMRWTLAWWQWLFAPSHNEFKPVPNGTAELNRGKYLVEGPGHCGACHTPRGAIGYQEKALSMEEGDAFLTGAVIDGWRAKSLRGEALGLAEWTVEELTEFFATGRTDKVAAFGTMSDVIEQSTQYLSEADNRAMAVYLKSLPPQKGRPVQRKTQEDKTTKALLDGKYDSRGAILYAEHCLACHRADGKGVARVFPALENNSAVFSNQAHSVIQITLEGGRMPRNQTDVMAFTMPSFRHLSDEDLRDVVNYVRNGWTNVAPEVSSKDISKIRSFVRNKAPNIVAAGENRE